MKHLNPNKKQVVVICIGLSILFPLIFNAVNRYLPYQKSLKDYKDARFSINYKLKMGLEAMKKPTEANKAFREKSPSLFLSNSESIMELNKTRKEFQQARKSLIISLSLIVMVTSTILVCLYLVQ